MSDVDTSGWTSLHIVSWYGTLGAARFVLGIYASNTARRRAITKKSDRKGHFAPHLAAARGHVDVLKLFRGISMDLIKLRDANGCTPWLFAAQRGQIKTLRWLWSECGKDKSRRRRLLESTDRWDQNALHLAAMNDCPNVVKLVSNEFCHDFDECKEILNISNAFGMKSLHVAAAKNRLAVLCSLLKAGARADEKARGRCRARQRRRQTASGG